MFEILQRGSADSFFMRRRGGYLTAGAYLDDVFPTDHWLKDIGYALKLAESVGVDAAGAGVARDRLQEATDRGWGSFYSPVVYRLFEK